MYQSVSICITRIGCIDVLDYVLDCQYMYLQNKVYQRNNELVYRRIYVSVYGLELCTFFSNVTVTVLNISILKIKLKCCVLYRRQKLTIYVPEYRKYRKFAYFFKSLNIKLDLKT